MYKSSASQLVTTTHNYRQTASEIVQSVTQYFGRAELGFYIILFQFIRISHEQWERFKTLNSTVQCYEDSEMPRHTSQATEEKRKKNAKYRKYEDRYLDYGLLV